MGLVFFTVTICLVIYIYKVYMKDDDITQLMSMKLEDIVRAQALAALLVLLIFLDIYFLVDFLIRLAFGDLPLHSYE